MEKNIYKYIAIVSFEDGWYGAEIPNFGEVYSQGKTLEELEKNMVDCLQLGIYGRLHDGEELPVPINAEDYKKKLKKGEMLLIIEADMNKAGSCYYK